MKQKIARAVSVISLCLMWSLNVDEMSLSATLLALGILLVICGASSYIGWPDVVEEWENAARGK